jgi:hypothetical protein
MPWSSIGDGWWLWFYSHKDFLDHLFIPYVCLFIAERGTGWVIVYTRWCSLDSARLVNVTAINYNTYRFMLKMFTIYIYIHRFIYTLAKLANTIDLYTYHKPNRWSQLIFSGFFSWESQNQGRPGCDQLLLHAAKGSIVAHISYISYNPSQLRDGNPPLVAPELPWAIGARRFLQIYSIQATFLADQR